MPEETFCDIEECIVRGHRFKTVWSDKTLKRVHLTCIDCSAKNGKTVFVAFSIEHRGFGRWLPPSNDPGYTPEPKDE